jgi:hypothetical protein
MCLAAERLTQYDKSMPVDDPEYGTIKPDLEACLDALRKAQNVNRLAQYYLTQLKGENLGFTASEHLDYSMM